MQEKRARVLNLDAHIYRNVGADDDRDVPAEMSGCSTIRDATTAVENRESAATEAHKEEALWRVSTGYGFVFDSAPFIAALRAWPAPDVRGRPAPLPAG